MAKLIQLPGGGPVNDGERLVVAALVRELPADYAVVPNVDMAAGNGQRLEYDAIVVAPHALYVIETKAWLGNIAGDDRAWLVDGSTRAAPIQITAHKARVLKSCLADELPLLNQAWVEPAVVLAFPPQSLVLTPAARRWTFDPLALIAFLQDPGRLPHRPRGVERLVERAVQVLRGSALPRSGPRALGQWQVIETLRSDGEEIEYRAVHKLAPKLRPVRLRVVSLSPYVFTPGELDRRRRLFTREFAALQAMGPHPNVAAAKDAFEDEEGNLVTVADEIEGLSLALAIDEGLDMTDDERLDVLRQLGLAVAHAHAHGVVHRRITPDNVILSTGGLVRLTGFGHARVEAEGTVYQMFAPEIDTRFLAPELIDPRRGEIGPRSDLYGLAATACALWTDEPPSPGGQGPEAMPKSLWPVVASWLAADPSDRCLTVDDLLAAIDACHTREPEPEPALRTVERIGKPAPLLYQHGDLIEDRYDVLGVLGSGAFSTVYHVHDTVSMTECALKMFGPNHGLDTVQRELRALLQIRHPNVVEVIDADRTETLPQQWFLKSEYVAGKTLADVTGDGSRLPVEQVMDVAGQLLDALSGFHPDGVRIAELKAKDELSADDFEELQQLQDHGLIHRDIKPQNIILRPDGRVKLVDFNIATPVGAPVLTVAGTPGYQPPAADLTAWDTSTDLFAVGVVLFQLVIGRHPYPNARPVSGETPTPARDLIPELPSDLAAFLDQACAPERSQRFASAAEMRDALSEVALGGAPSGEIGAAGIAEFWVQLRSRLVGSDLDPIPEGHAKPAIVLGEPLAGIVLGVKLFGQRVRVHLDAGQSFEGAGQLRQLLSSFRELTGLDLVSESSWIAAYETGKVFDPLDLPRLARWTADALDALTNAVTWWLSEGEAQREATTPADTTIVVDPGPLPTDHHPIGWLRTADYRYPLVQALLPKPEGSLLGVLSATTAAGDKRYAASKGAHLWLPGGQALSFDNVVTARWDLAPPCCEGGAGSVVAEQTSLTEWWFRHNHPGGDGLGLRLDFHVLDKGGSAWVALAVLGPEPVDSVLSPIEANERQEEPLLDAALGRFIDDRSGDEERARLARLFATGALARDGLTFEIGRSTRSDDGWNNYAMVRTIAKHSFGAVAYLWPGSARVDLRLSGDVATGRRHAERRPGKGTHAYQLRVPLTSDGAVAEALEMLDLAVAEVLSPAAEPTTAPAPRAPVPPSAVEAEVNPADLEKAFHLALIDGVKRCRREISYNPTAFAQMLSDKGGVETARILLRTPGTSEGFATLWERGRLDLAVEAIVLRPEFTSLFTEDERQTARQRLLDHGADPEGFGQRRSL